MKNILSIIIIGIMLIGIASAVIIPTDIRERVQDAHGDIYEP